MASWPSSLPAPRIVGYGVNPFDPAARTDMEAGNSRARRRTFSRKDKVPVVWNMTDAQYAIFRTWFDMSSGADGGAAWFSVVLLGSEYGMQTVEAKFSGVFQSQYVPHLHWDVSATLETRVTPLTLVEQENMVRGIFEKDVVLLWSPTTQADVLVSKIGPDAEFASTGVQYDEDGVSLGSVAALHSKGVWVGPAYSNLFSGPVEAQTKALTAQKYTVWCDTGSVVCGAYGTATPSTPLTFTATAGDCTFTPTGVTKWMLTATVAPMPYVAPGTSVASAAGSATNGLSWALSAEMTAALSGACTVAAEVTIGISGDDMTIGSFYGILSCKDTNQELLHMSRGSSVGEYRIVRSTDGFAVKLINSPFNRYERHIKIVQTNADGTQFRVGNKRVGIDSAIQWGAWSNFDGSFNPLTHLRAAYGNTVPLWLSKVMVSKLGGLTDAQIEARVYA